MEPDEALQEARVIASKIEDNDASLATLANIAAAGAVVLAIQQAQAEIRALGLTIHDEFKGVTNL
jgi:hypothetical protein